MYFLEHTSLLLRGMISGTSVNQVELKAVEIVAPSTRGYHTLKGGVRCAP